MSISADAKTKETTPGAASAVTPLALMLVVAIGRALRYALTMSRLRTLIRARQYGAKVEKLFARRAERFQAECGWCGKRIGDDDPVVVVSALVYDDIDLSLVEGKVVEVAFSVSRKTVLAGVAAFDSEAKAEGKDLVFMVCSDTCGERVQTAFADELRHGLTIQ